MLRAALLALLVVGAVLVVWNGSDRIAEHTEQQYLSCIQTAVTDEQVSQCESDRKEGLDGYYVP